MKSIYSLVIALLLPLVAHADVNIIIGQPPIVVAPPVIVAPRPPVVVVAPPVVVAPRPVVIVIGSRDRRGYYWDGRYWRAPKYWHAHYHHHNGHWKYKKPKHHGKHHD